MSTIARNIIYSDKQFKDLTNKEREVVFEQILFEIERNNIWKCDKPIYSLRKIVKSLGFSYEQLLNWCNDPTSEYEGFDLEECFNKCVINAKDELWLILEREWFNFCEDNELEDGETREIYVRIFD